MLCIFIIWIFIVLCQLVIIPRCNFLIIILVLTTLKITAGCVLVMAEEFPGLPKCLRKSSSTLVHDRNRRTIFVCAAIIIMSAASSMGLIFCYSEESNQIDESTTMSTTAAFMIPRYVKNSLFLNESDYGDQETEMVRRSTIDRNQLIDKSNRTENDIVSTIRIITTANDVENDNDYGSCLEPEYIVFTWVLCLVALATALKLYYLVKTFMALGLVTVFCVLILIAYPQHFDQIDDVQLGMPLSAIMVILLMVFLTMVVYHARLVEVTARLDFIWKEQAERELTNMKSNRHLNDTLIKNILPEHVASYYLSHESSDDLYSKMHDLCGVMFASIPNFKDFYSEDIENGKACIRILNEIICDFDSLMDEPRFATVEKIKTVGATYMCASGLNPKHRVSDECLIGQLELISENNFRVKWVTQMKTVSVI